MNLTLEDEEWNSNFFSSPDWTGRNKTISLIVTITHSPACKVRIHVLFEALVAS